MSVQKRPYTKKRRAEQEAETRLRITESMVELHGTVGPAKATVSALADRAGVRRSTIYRHFPDEEALFAACSAHWALANPLPDLGTWAQVEDPDERLRVALTELYGFYGRTEQMLANLLRDEEHVPVLRDLLGGYRAYLRAATDVLLAGRAVRGAARRRTEAAIGHALAFPTWRSLAVEHGLSRRDAVAMMAALTAAAGG